MRDKLPEYSGKGLAAGLWQDLKIGLRTLAKGPGFTAVAVVTLALGIGATTAFFSIVHAVLLKPLPYSDPDRLVVLQGAPADRGKSSWSVSPLDFEDWKRATDSFEAMALTTYWTFNVIGPQAPERVLGNRVTGEFFELLGVPALVGRTLMDDDDRPGAPDTVVLSYGFWQRMFGADPEILGRILTLNGRSHTIVGVMPSYFAFPAEDVAVWGALADNMGELPRDSRFLLAVARMKPSVKPEQAQAEMTQVAAQLEEEYPDTNKGWGVKVVSAHQILVGDVQAALWILLGAVGFALLIACTNVANLQLARQAARQQELAIRTALGASPWRVMRQVLTENILLTLFGAALGLGIAFFAVDWLKRFYPGEVHRLADAEVNLAIVAIAAGLALVTALGLGAIAIFQASQHSTDDALKENRRTLAGGRKLEQMRRLLVTGEVALALVLLIGGGLLVRSFVRVTAVDPGFRTENLLSFNVWPTTSAYREPHQQKEYIRRTMESLATLPGVEAVGAVSQLPLSAGRTALKFEVEGKLLPLGDAPEADYRSVSPSYFEMVGVPLLRGRSLTPQDREPSQKVVVVNDKMARQIWPGEDPVGSRIRWTDPKMNAGWLTVVGVVGDVKSLGLDAQERPAVYVPYMQRTHPHMRWTGFVVRAQGDAGALWPSVRKAFVDLDPTIPVYDVRTMDDRLDSSVAERRFYAHFLGGFAFVALVLGVVGVYGVISYSVSRRTHEMGLRMALGAQRADVMRLVVRQGMRPALAGLGLGAISALALTRWMKSLLFEISATDPMTFVGVTIGLGLVALVACMVPALRATRVDPSSALRHE